MLTMPPKNDKTIEVTFRATTGYQVPTMEDAEEFLKEWIRETYPEFYDVTIDSIQEVN